MKAGALLVGAPAFFYVHGWTVRRGRMDAQERRAFKLSGDIEQ